MPEPEPRHCEVGFIVNSDHIDSVLVFRNISKRICLLKLKSKKNNIVLMQCYAPDCSYPDIDIDNFYNEVQSLIVTVAKRDDLIVMGDFNAQVGGIEEPGTTGNFSIVKRGHNDRGESLVLFCKRNDLMITNTFFKHR